MKKRYNEHLNYFKQQEFDCTSRIQMEYIVRSDIIYFRATQ